MKRDPIPTPGPAAQPAYATQRNSRVIVSAAMVALHLREYTIKALAEHLAETHPNQHLNMPDLVAMLINRGDAEFVDETLGLTDQGEEIAAKLHERLEPRPSPVRLNELERRISALAPGLLRLDPDGQVRSASSDLLTRGQPRAAASAADLAPPPSRPGGDTCLALPSRIGQELHYRDGRITRMDGTEIQPARQPTTYRPTRDGRNPDQRMGWRESQATW